MWQRTAVLRGVRRDWDAMANGNGIVPDQDIFDHEPYDSLALSDAKRFSSGAQAGEERREGLRQAQEDCPVVGLVNDPAWSKNSNGLKWHNLQRSCFLCLLSLVS